MNFLNDKRKKKIFITLSSITLAIALLVAACAVYLCDYYRADTEAIEAYAPENAIEPDTLKDGTIVFYPENATRGFIFYPGGKVEYTAYVPLMKALSAEGIMCVLVEMPFNLAVLDVHAAEGIKEQYQSIEEWYIGGHSLGGSMAASHLAGCVEEYAGLVLLGSYSTADLSEKSLKVLSVYGSEDMVMNREKYSEYKPNLPADFCEVIIDGGCHAGFGMYGPQSGDGTPNISTKKQIEITAEYILALMQ